MRIKQARVSHSIRFFKDRFLEKFGFEDYSDPFEPAVFFGCYGPVDRKAIAEHQSLAVLIWGGSDATLRANIDFFSHLPRSSMNPICYVAISSYIAEDLKAQNWPFLRRNITPANTEQFHPKPLGKKVYCYGGSEDNKHFYGYALLEELQQRLPDVEFLFHYSNPPTVPHDRMSEIYEQCCLGLRLVQHDGCSNTIVEMGLMGRKCIWNGDLPNAIPWSDLDSVVAAIEHERSRAGQLDLNIAEQVLQAISERDWLETDNYPDSILIYQRSEKPFRLFPEDYLDIAMITAPREKPTIQKSLASLRQAGFHQQVTIYAEPGNYDISDPNVEIKVNVTRLGAFSNFHNALSNTVANTNKPYLLISLDDIIYVKNLNQYIRHTLQMNHPDFGYYALITVGHDIEHLNLYNQLGWHVNTLQWHCWGGQFLMRTEIARRIMQTEYYQYHLNDYIVNMKNQQIDVCVSHAIAELGLPMYLHVPSLADHIGETSTLDHGPLDADRCGYQFDANRDLSPYFKRFIVRDQDTRKLYVI